MGDYSRQDLIISIENSVDFIKSCLDSADETVAFIFKKHGVSDLDKASLSALNELFNEIYAIEANLR